MIEKEGICSGIQSILADFAKENSKLISTGKSKARMELRATVIPVEKDIKN